MNDFTLQRDRRTCTAGVTLGLALLIGLGAIRGWANPQPGNPSPMDRQLAAVLAELNVARTNTAKYVQYLKRHRSSMKGNTYVGHGGACITTQEGVKAVDEAIEVLSKQKPLPALTFSEGMARGAMDHVEDTGPKGMIGHKGTDGTFVQERVSRYGKWEGSVGENISYGPRNARDIVLDLIIDDGVADRGHRHNIYQEDYAVVGIATGPHKTFGSMCVMGFAGGFQDDMAAIRSRQAGKKASGTGRQSALKSQTGKFGAKN